MDNQLKFITAVTTLKSTAQVSFAGDIETEEDFNKVEFLQANNSWSTNNPHSEITWTLTKAEMDKL